MPDEQPEVSSIRFVQVIRYLVETWPPLVEISHRWLEAPHVYHSIVDGDTLTIKAGNGVGVYRLLRDRPYGNGIVAELLGGDAPHLMKRRGKKYEVDA